MYIQLEDGSVFEGKQFSGTEKCVGGQLMVYSAMIGHQEVMTDPSNLDRMLLFTYPLIGGYGMNFDDAQADGPTISAFICRRAMGDATNFRSEMNLKEYLDYYDVVGIEEVDTRGLIKHLNESGMQRAVITDRLLTPSEMDEFFSEQDINTIEKVSTIEVTEIEGDGKTIALWDFGVKDGILEKLSEEGYRIVVYPAMTNYEEILKDDPDVLFLSSGPGMAANYLDIVHDVGQMLGKLPIYGIGLGAQFLGLALGGNLQKLARPHVGASIAVKGDSSRVFMTSQNHDYHIEHLPESVAITYTHIGDDTIEGFYDERAGAYGVLFDPFGLPGAKDLLDEQLSRLSELA
ncbi:MAG: carbamoyl phosphate synthase small subunit [Peptoniphilus sp.]|nr:carbamoyl phosphate synthase small subunit [Peptoniphilus sp.]MDD7363238.1 carbamoyl phosphate synthase small subunit [Bacillota bacterium]MDY6045331.1 carbamoyl phosphate synthase small subunit [Peptoniphilus sp.]